MKLAVISDLHLGPGDASERFGHDEARFLKFLTFLESNFERVVLLGDIWETLTSRRIGRASDALRACREAHAAIAKRFERKAYVYIHGNHDIVTDELESAPSEVALEVDGTRLLFTHGHEHDLLIRRARWLSEVAVWLGGWLLRQGLSPVYRAFDWLDGARSGVSGAPDRCSFRRWALARARARQADVIVTAHTHLAARSEHAGRLYLNSGSCSEGRVSFLAIDTRAGTYRVEKSW